MFSSICRPHLYVAVFQQKDNLKNQVLCSSPHPPPNTHLCIFFVVFFAESSVTNVMKEKQNGKEKKITDANIRLHVCLSC